MTPERQAGEVPAPSRPAKFDARESKITDLRFLAGLSVEGISRALGMSAPTVQPG